MKKYSYDRKLFSIDDLICLYTSYLKMKNKKCLAKKLQMRYDHLILIFGYMKKQFEGIGEFSRGNFVAILDKVNKYYQLLLVED
jgi:hypothetical protein